MGNDLISEIEKKKNQKNKNILKFALASAVMVGSVAFTPAANAVNVSDYSSFSDSNNYRANTITNITQNITMGGSTFAEINDKSSLTINGNNYSILGDGNASRWHFIYDPSLTIQNITFSNFKHSSNGQGLLDITARSTSWTSTDVTLNNLTINGITNDADSNPVWGGGITLEGATSASIIGSSIEYITLLTSTSEADGASGAAIYIKGSDRDGYSASTLSLLKDTKIQNNSITASNVAAQGGGIANEGKITKITGTTDGTSVFSSNTSEQTGSGDAYGGAIANGSTNTGRGDANIGEISNTAFSSNTVKTNSGTAYGGAIWNKSGASIDTITGSTFTGNKAETTSGSAYGGAIYNTGTISEITDTNFTDNSATTQGGAIYNAGTIKLNSTNDNTMTFSGNSAKEGSDLYQTSTGSTTISGDGNIVFNGTIAGAGSITSTGNITLNGDNTGYTGTFTQTAGSTTVGTQGKLFGATSTISGGTLNYNSSSDLSDSQSLVMKEAALAVGDGTNATTLSIKNNSSLTDMTSIAVNSNASLINNNALSTNELTNSGTFTNTSSSTTITTLANTGTISNTGSMSINGGTNSNAISGTGSTTVTGNLTNSGSIAQTSVTNSGTITNTGTITGAITNAAGGTITSSATNLVGAIANAGTLKLSGGTTQEAITNYNDTNGTINLSGDLTANHAISGNTLNLAGNTVTITKDTGSLNLAGLKNAGGAIDAANSSANDTITLGSVTLNGNLNLSIDADLENQTADQITGTEITANGHSIIIDRVNVLSNPTAALPINLQVADSTLKDAVKLVTTINTRITDSTDNTKSYLMSYTTDDNAGYLSFGYGDLYTAVHYDAAQRTYTLNADENEGRNLGTMEGTNAVLNVTSSDSKYSVNGNSHQGVTIGSGNTMNIENVGGYSLDVTQQPDSGQYVTYKDANGATKYAIINGSWNGFSLALDNEGTLNIKNSTFYNNTSKDGRGGAVYNEGTAKQIDGAFISNTVKGNQSKWPAGGAIFNNGQTTDGHVAGTIDKISGIFINNSVDSSQNGYGGAILNQSTISSIAADFIGNKVDVTSSGYAAQGGAILNEGSITSILGNFVNNSAISAGKNSQGGAILNKPGMGSGTIGSIGSTDTQTAFTGNSADIGGAIYNDTGATISAITNTTFTNNTATTGNGGAIYNSGTMNLTDVLANGNSAGGLGGAIYTSADMTITDSSFSDTELNYHTINGTQTQNDIYIDGANVTFNVADTDLEAVYAINSGIAGTSTSTFTKSGEGTLQVNGVNKDFAGTFNITEGNVFFNAAEETDSFVSGSIKIAENSTLTADVSDNLSQTINNVSGAGEFYKSGAGILTLNGKNDEFTGTANILEGTLKYVADDENDRYFGGDTILDSTLELDISNNATNQTITNLLSGGEGTGTLIKNGAGTMTIENTGIKSITEEGETVDLSFTGTMNVNEGTLNVTAPTTQTTEGAFNFTTNIANDAIYNYTAISTDKYTFNNESAVKFTANSEGTAANGATAGFTNGTYTLESDLSGAIGNTTSFTSATVNATGTTYGGNYALNNSILNLADDTVSNVTFNQLSTSGTNQLKLDFSFAGTTTDTEGNTHSGTVDTLTSTNAANGTLTLDSLNAISLDSDNGTTGGSYNVLKNLTWASDGSTEIKSDIYKYTATTTAGVTDLTLTATGYVGNTLYTLNHERYGDRTFQLVGDNTNYYIGQNLLSTNAGDKDDTSKAGTLNIVGRTNADGTLKGDTIIASTNSTSSDHLSMFVMDNEKANTTLNISGVTIKDTSSTQGSVINATSTLAAANLTNTTVTGNTSTSAGGAIYNNGTLKVENSTFSNNTVNGSDSTAYGGAIYNKGTISALDAAFTGNKVQGSAAEAAGGAIFNYSEANNYAQSHGTIEKIKGSFNTNSVESSQHVYGGAIINHGLIGTIAADFTGNTITGGNGKTANGGAIVNNGTITSIEGTTADKVIFSKNTASGSNGQGGAIFNNANQYGKGKIQSISNAEFTENSAARGGAIFNGGIYTNDGTSITSEISSITNTAFNNNSATDGSAIYNAGTMTLKDVTFSGNTGNSYIYNTGTMTIATDNANIALDNQGTSGNNIVNNGTLNLNQTTDKTFTVADILKSTLTDGKGTVNTNAVDKISFNNLVDNMTVNVQTGSAKFKNQNAGNVALNNSNLNISSGATATVTDSNITGGNAVVNSGSILNFVVNSDKSNTTTAAISGQGTINKTGTGTEKLAADDSGFTGVANINEGTLQFEKTAETASYKYFGSDSTTKVTGSTSVLDYIDTAAGSATFDSSFSKINLAEGGTLKITGNGSASNFTLGSGLANSDTSTNNLIFNSANYVINSNNITTAKTQNKDLITFNDSTITMGQAMGGEAETAGTYDLSSANYKTVNSTLDLVNKTAGDNYVFDALTMDKSNFGIDVDLVVDTKTSPYADTITAQAGSGQVALTKLFITDDNGKFAGQNKDGKKYTKGAIQVFKNSANETEPGLQVANTDGVKVLSWATNIYKYNVESATTKYTGDSIEVIAEGNSSTDTLRDLNRYNTDEQTPGGNRGFSYIVDTVNGTNSYNIYRNLDETTQGNFTIIGVSADKAGTKADGTAIGKSILSGELKPLVVYQDDSARLAIGKDSSGNPTYAYDGIDVTGHVKVTQDSEGKNVYTIDVAAFSDNDKDYGSMFEIVNNTTFEMSDVSVENAKRYSVTNEKDTSLGENYKTDGAAIYANNADATIKLTDVDFKNNSVESGKGGAIANYSSSQFTLTNSVISGNSAGSDGGAIYNASTGMTLTNITADNNRSGGKGGAIYTSADMTITDSSFGKTTLNYHTINGKETQNDIYIDKSAKLTFITQEAGSGGVESLIRSGIAGSTNSTFIKSGDGVLKLKGSNSDFEGTFALTGGTVNYTADDANDTFASGKVQIAQGAELVMNISNNDSIATQSIQNVSGYTKDGTPTSGTITKTGAGALNLSGDNSGFTGQTNIKAGTLAYNADKTTDKYFGGNTVISKDANLTLDIDENAADQTISQISSETTGTGSITKTGEGEITLSGDNSGFTGTANVNAGTLKTTGTKTDDFDFTTVINNAGTLDYTAATGAELTLNKNSKVSFGSTGSETQSATAQFTGGTFNLSNDIKNVSGNNIIIDSATVKTTSTNYSAGNYTIKNSIIDLTNNTTENTTFNYLATDNTELKIDVNLGLPDNAIADTLTATTGGTDIKIALTDLNIFGKTDDGTGSEYTINVLGGKLKFDKDKSIGAISTDVYEYGVSTSGQDLKLTVNKSADNNSLKKMNQYKIDTEEEGKTREFTFTSNPKDNPYTISESLETTAAGIFTVNGYIDETTGKKTVVSGADESGQDSKSFFETTREAETDLRINNLIISDAHNEKGGSAVLSDSTNAKVTLNNVDVTSSSSDGNGGAINNTNSKSFSITGGTMSGNTSGKLGGAVYTAADMTITDTNFSGNSDKNGSNDIYIDGENTTVEFITNNESSISSGIAGNGTFNKTGNETLNLSGKNDNFTGNLNVSEGSLKFTQNNEGDTYISGNTNINGTSVEINNDKSDITAGTFSGTGTLDKSGSKNMTLSGDNSNFTGGVNITDGSITFNSNSNEDKYFSGSTNIGQSGSLIVNTNQNTTLSNISGTGTLSKGGNKTLIIMGDNTGFNGNLNVDSGVFAMASGAEIGEMQSGTFADGTSINLQNTTAVQDASGNWTTNPNPSSIENLYFTTLNLKGNVNLSIDADLKSGQADKIGAGSVTGGGHLILGQNSINAVSDSLLNNTSLQIAYGALAQNDNIILGTDARTVMGPIQKYDVTYAGGNLNFARQGGTTPDINSVNLAVMASPVATQVGGYLAQLETLNAGFFHMDRYTKYPHNLRLTAENTNKYAATGNAPLYLKSTLPETSSAMWVKPYTTFEKVNLKGGIGVSNVSYGSLFGGDSNLVDLGHGFKGVISAFIGYNGSHQTYNGVSINQQGGMLGVTGTLYKGNFFTGLTVSTGASAGDAFTRYGTDHFSMITAGVANKTGYNWEIKDGKVIVQPSLFLGYTFVNTFDYTNAAGVRMDSDPLHAIQVVPGVKVISNLKNGWQPYLGVNMVWSIMDKTEFMANDVRLPQLSVKPYVEYGVGIQKTWGEKFTAFFQTMLRNGGRNGVSLSAGFRWLLGKESKYPNKKGQANSPKRTVIKSL